MVARTSLESIRVLIADDHPYYRRGLARRLEKSGIRVVVEASNGEAAIRAFEETAPDVVVMDLQMPGLSGLEATRRLTQRWPASRVLVLSVSAQEADVTDAILAGATGYVLKDEPVEQVIAGIQAAASGKPVLSPRVAKVLLRRVRDSIAAGEDMAGGGLSASELEVLHLLAEGLPDQEIAEALGMSASAVSTHVSSILKKLEFETRVIAAIRAQRDPGK
jgi:DNA-binding NarL/FixJ family response regulator